jgi:hypothetical protein
MSEHLKGPENSRRYEDSNVSVRHLFALAMGVVALVMVGVLGSAFVFHFFILHTPMGPAATPFDQDVRDLPPELRLQTTAPLDLKHYRDEQDKILAGYGWVDPHAGVVRIPVERAMELMLQKGYPARDSAAAEAKTSKAGAAPKSVGAEAKP